MKKKEAIITIAVFLVLLFGLTIWNLLTPDREFSYNENKYLDQMPSFTLEKLLNGKWQSEFESYITDQFIGRDTWVELNVMTERGIGKKDVNGVLFADDHYMIQMYKPQDIDPELVNKNLQRLHGFVEKSKELVGLEHTSVMLVPTASEVLSDKLPEFAEGMLYDQKELLRRAEEQVGDEAWIDVQSVLDQHKDEYIFYRTDHHWTMTGAFYAYQQWMSQKGYGTVSLDDYEQVTLSEELLIPRRRRQARRQIRCSILRRILSRNTGCIWRAQKRGAMDCMTRPNCRKRTSMLLICMGITAW